MVFLGIGALALNGYAAVLIIMRSVGFGTRLYRPMLWNIFLSLLPIIVLVCGIVVWVLFAALIPPLGPVAAILAALIWLVLLPNASYLITELNLSHRAAENDPVPIWYDIIMVISLAMSGVINMVVNVLLVHLFYGVIIQDDADALASPLILSMVVCVMLLLGLGMYLGRYIRVNSWDVKHPVMFAKKLITHFRTPAHALACVFFTLTYAVFMLIIYITVAGPILQGIVETARNFFA